MQTVVAQHGVLRLEQRPAPKPGAGQVVLKVLRCGICGSDLHLRHHCDHLAGIARRVGYEDFPSSSDALVFGHEFCGEVLDHGPRTPKKLKVGTRVCAVPLLRRGDAIDLIGISAHAPGAYAEQVLTQQPLLMPVPNGLATDTAALTEPMAVALHAVNRSEIKSRDVAIVIGCGPVGLAITAILKAQGVRAIVASDYSAARRRLASTLGAHITVDPQLESPYQTRAAKGHLASLPALIELGVSTREQLGRLPVQWWRAWRLAEQLGAAPKRPIIFECVGAPGLLQSILDGAPVMSRVVVVGVCMQTDAIEPAMAVNKEIELRFVLGYSPLEFRDALHLLAEGKVKADAMITRTIGLAEVADAFDQLGKADQDAKVLIDPSRRTS